MIDSSGWEINGAIHWIVDRYHVGTPYREIRDDIARRIKSDVPALERRHLIRDAMRAHYRNRLLYARVMDGRL